MLQSNTWNHDVRQREQRAEGASPVTMSKRYWDLDWSNHLPWAFEDVRVETATAEEATAFIGVHYAKIFAPVGGERRFLADPLTEAKRRFLLELDLFAFRNQNDMVGLLMAQPSDWTSYYFRTVAILPEYRDRRLLSRFLERVYEPLRDAGVERVEGDCSPTNLPMARVLVGQGYVVTSTSNSERWGLVLRYSKFLTDDANEAFKRQYCLTSPALSRGDNRTTERRTL